MLTGEYRHSVDSKNRLFIPAKHREALGPTFMITWDIGNKRLMVYSMEEWEKYLAPIRAMKRDESKNIMRILHTVAVMAEPDSQGRVVLTATLLQRAGITKDAVIVGCGDFAEIWSAEEYDSVGLQISDETYAQMKALGL